jgi:hypothetical protein
MKAVIRTAAGLLLFGALFGCLIALPAAGALLIMNGYPFFGVVCFVTLGIWIVMSVRGGGGSFGV